MRTAASYLVAGACAVVLSYASIGLAAPSPPTAEAVRPCSSRGDSSAPQELPTPAGERIGPIVIWPSIRTRVEAYSSSMATWAFYAKAPIVVPARLKVTLVVPAEARHLMGFQAAGGKWISSVRFESCREKVRASPGAYNGTVGKFTGFPFGFGLARRSMCVPLEVWIEGRAAPARRLIPVGRRSCA